jgi:hypothetical protein
MLRVDLRRLLRMRQRMLMRPMSRMRVMGRFLVVAAVMKCRGLRVMCRPSCWRQPIASTQSAD